MKKGVLVVAAILFSAAGFVQAQEAELHGVVDLTFQSKYIWRGFDVYPDKSAIQATIDLDLYGTGFGISAVGHRANSSGFENTERWDYTLYYCNRLFEKEAYETLYRIGWVYYNYPNISSELADLQEIHAVLSWPNVLGVKGLVPTYCLVKLWPSESGSLVASKVDLTTGMPTSGTASGWAHILMLDYGWEVTCPITNGPRTLNLHSEVVFNDGVGPAGQNVDQDWSNAVFGVSTDFVVAQNLVFTPGLCHQVTMDRSVNDDKDETWVTGSLKYKF